MRPGQDAAFRVAVLMACHNRRETTLACLASLEGQAGLPSEFRFDCYLLDDGSSDGTAQAVAERFPWVTILEGDGTCFWAGGMRRAWLAAMAVGYDAYFWLNDDTHLNEFALSRFLQHHDPKASKPRILIGATLDPDTGELTYSGVNQPRTGNPMRFQRVAPTAGLTRCDTFNGNAVWVPQAVVERIGILDSAFSHGIADFDYGLRATAAGLGCWLLPEPAGVCSANRAIPWLAPSLSLRGRIRRILSPKGLPARQWRLFCYRHGRHAWRYWWLGPYLRVCLVHARTLLWPRR